VNGHEIALWSAVAAAFGYLVAIGIFDVLDPDQWVEYLGALIAALVTGGAVYAKQRLDDAKKRDNGSAAETLHPPLDR
jgi:cyclopropane fatty-acyl-phospholipid synthase-like methyltransferase